MFSMCNVDSYGLDTVKV